MIFSCLIIFHLWNKLIVGAVLFHRTDTENHLNIHHLNFDLLHDHIIAGSSRFNAPASVNGADGTSHPHLPHWLITLRGTGAGAGHARFSETTSPTQYPPRCCYCGTDCQTARCRMQPLPQTPPPLLPSRPSFSSVSPNSMRPLSVSRFS